MEEHRRVLVSYCAMWTALRSLGGFREQLGIIGEDSVCLSASTDGGTSIGQGLEQTLSPRV